MRAIILVALSVAFATSSLGSAANADHEASICGRLDEYQPPPSDNLGHGYGHVRLTTASGATSVLFHHVNPSNTPSTTQPGSTQKGANICISGPYVHVVGSSPYVSPYNLRLAGPKSLPSTSTALSDRSPVLALALLAVTAAVVELRVFRRRYTPSLH